MAKIWAAELPPPITAKLTRPGPGDRNHLVEHAATPGIDMQIAQLPPGVRGFTPLPRRWVVERALGRLMQHRRPARDYETLSASSEAMIHITSINLMTRRLTGENTPPSAALVTNHLRTKRPLRV
ncbi:hypothetical protein ACFVH6_23545 [Spirillospora sp. NPDC127200]